MGVLTKLRKVLNPPVALAFPALVAFPEVETPENGNNSSQKAKKATATPPNLKSERPYIRLVRPGEPPTEHELAAIEQRQLSFESKGFTAAESESLADGLLLRDRDVVDTRRACGECRNWFGGRCKLRLYPIGDEPVIYALHRCDVFES